MGGPFKDLEVTLASTSMFRDGDGRGQILVPHAFMPIVSKAPALQGVHACVSSVRLMCNSATVNVAPAGLR